MNGFEKFEISNYGNVRYKYKNGRYRTAYTYVDGVGYPRLLIRKNGKNYGKYIHRLVAEYFIPNPNNYNEVDHIDRNKLNNHVSNLRWCTSSTNNFNRGKKVGKRPVTQYDLNNNKIAEFKSVSDASKTLGLHHARIYEVASGTRKSIKGYIFKFKGG